VAWSILYKERVGVWHGIGGGEGSVGAVCGWCGGGVGAFT